MENKNLTKIPIIESPTTHIEIKNKPWIKPITIINITIACTNTHINININKRKYKYKELNKI